MFDKALRNITGAKLFRYRGIIQKLFVNLHYCTTFLITSKAVFATLKITEKISYWAVEYN